MQKSDRNKIQMFMDRTLAGIHDVYNMVFGIIRPVLSELFEILDEGHVSQRAAVWAGIALNVYCVHWCFELVKSPPETYSGTDIAAIIGALLVPIAGLTGALMKYGETKIESIKKQRKQENEDAR